MYERTKASSVQTHQSRRERKAQQKRQLPRKPGTGRRWQLPIKICRIRFVYLKHYHRIADVKLSTAGGATSAGRHKGAGCVQGTRQCSGTCECTSCTVRLGFFKVDTLPTRACVRRAACEVTLCGARKHPRAEAH